MPKRSGLLVVVAVMCFAASSVAAGDWGVVKQAASLAGAVVTQAGQAGSGPAFVKVQRKIIARQIVWFNGREGDLESGAFVSKGRTYLSVTDLMRHIGGTIIWGPSDSYIELHRRAVAVRVIPGSNIVYVNGRKVELERACMRIKGRTFVPLRLYCNLFGIHTDWNETEGRAYVTFAEE